MIKLIGIPFETSGNFLRGAALGVSHIRWHLWGIDKYSPHFNAKMPPYEDLGDIWTDFDEPPKERLEYIKTTLRKLVRNDGNYIFLGGDHTITLATAEILREVFGEFVILHLDAHLDRWDDFEGKYSHATVMRRLEEMGFTVGTFGYRTVGDQEYIPKICGGIEDAFKFISEHERIYLSFDFDFFDPSVFPAVSNPEPMGASFRDFINLLKHLKGRLIGAELVEYVPLLDTSRTCGSIAALVLREVMVSLQVGNQSHG